MNRQIVNKTLVLALLAVSSISAYAQLNLPNPLVEPISRQRASRQGAGEAPGLPPLPGYSGRASSQATDGSTLSQDSKNDSSLSSARTQFNGFSVVAILGDKAVLRRQASQTGAAGAGISQMSGGQIPLAGQNAGTNTTTMNLKSESITVRNGEPFDYMAGSGTLYAKVSDERVIIYLDGAGSHSSGKKDVVFAGELQATIMQPRTISLQNKDTEYKQSLNVKANDTTSTQSDSSNSGNNNNNNNNNNSSSGSNQGSR